jgi:hypothetical protein
VISCCSRTLWRAMLVSWFVLVLSLMTQLSCDWWTAISWIDVIAIAHRNSRRRTLGSVCSHWLNLRWTDDFYCSH